MKKIGGYLLTCSAITGCVGMLLTGQLPSDEQWGALGASLAAGVGLLWSAYKKVRGVEE
jgi:threonine/homoserine efflux transporter RhtA